jgi:hypothetical protein
MTRIARRTAIALTGSAVLASALVGVAPTVASADPGFCGVKVATQGYSGGWLYTGRNKCSSSIRVQAVVQGHGLQCETIDPHLQYTWWSVTLDTSWYMRNC